MNEILSVVQNGIVIHVKNPLYGNENIAYNNLINNFNFRCKGLNQTNNFQRLKLSIIPFNLNLNWVTIKIDKPVYFINRVRTQFIATTPNNEIIWYKYEGPFLGGGQNYVFIYGKRIKLSEWFAMSNSDRLNLINSLNQN